MDQKWLALLGAMTFGAFLASVGFYGIFVQKKEERRRQREEQSPTPPPARQ